MQMELLDLVCNLEILHALIKKVDRNLSELIRQIVKDAGEWLSFIHRDDANNESATYKSTSMNTAYSLIWRALHSLMLFLAFKVL